MVGAQLDKKHCTFSLGARGIQLGIISRLNITDLSH